MTLVDAETADGRAVFYATGLMVCDLPTAAEDERRAPKHWPSLRAIVLDRDDYTCWLCGGPATEVDHLFPKAHGGRDKLSNLRAACRTCNAVKGEKIFPGQVTVDRAADAFWFEYANAHNAMRRASRWGFVAAALMDADHRLTADEMVAVLNAATDHANGVGS